MERNFCRIFFMQCKVNSLPCLSTPKPDQIKNTPGATTMDRGAYHPIYAERCAGADH